MLGARERWCWCGTEVLGTRAEFKKNFEVPINAGREKNANPSQIELAKRRAIVVTHMLKSVVLRRDAEFLRCVSAALVPGVVRALALCLCDDLYGVQSRGPCVLACVCVRVSRQSLPPKREWVLVCRLSELQARLYRQFLRCVGAASAS